jgi:Family of unknown function (DUF6790)
MRRLSPPTETDSAPCASGGAISGGEGGGMIGDTIAFVLSNLPAFLLIAALIIAAFARTPSSLPERCLAWLLLLPVGGSGLWAALFHLAFPAFAAAHIGWAPSPFQFEVGMADLAIGATACLSFWRDLGFKAAVVMVNAIFLIGDAIGHVRQMMVAGNFAPGNAGTPFFTDIILPVLTIALLLAAQRSEQAQAVRTR